MNDDAVRCASDDGYGSGRKKHHLQHRHPHHQHDDDDDDDEDDESAHYAAWASLALRIVVIAAQHGLPLDPPPAAIVTACRWLHRYLTDADAPAALRGPVAACLVAVARAAPPSGATRSALLLPLVHECWCARMAADPSADVRRSCAELLSALLCAPDGDAAGSHVATAVVRGALEAFLHATHGSEQLAATTACTALHRATAHPAPRRAAAPDTVPLAAAATACLWSPSSGPSLVQAAAAAVATAAPDDWLLDVSVLMALARASTDTIAAAGPCPWLPRLLALAGCVVAFRVPLRAHWQSLIRRVLDRLSRRTGDAASRAAPLPGADALETLLADRPTDLWRPAAQSAVDAVFCGLRHGAFAQDRLALICQLAQLAAAATSHPPGVPMADRRLQLHALRAARFAIATAAPASADCAAGEALGAAALRAAVRVVGIVLGLSHTAAASETDTAPAAAMRPMMLDRPPDAAAVICEALLLAADVAAHSCDAAQLMRSSASAELRAALLRAAADAPWEVHDSACECLALLLRAHPTLATVPDWLVAAREMLRAARTDASAYVRASAVTATCELHLAVHAAADGSPESLRDELRCQLLASLRDDEAFPRRASAAAIVRCLGAGTAPLVDALLAALVLDGALQRAAADLDADVQCCCAQACGAIVRLPHGADRGPPMRHEATELLRALAVSPERTVRRAARDALHAVGIQAGDDADIDDAGSVAVLCMDGIDDALSTHCVGGFIDEPDCY